MMFIYLRVERDFYCRSIVPRLALMRYMGHVHPLAAYILLTVLPLQLRGAMDKLLTGSLA